MGLTQDEMVIRQRLCHTIVQNLGYEVAAMFFCGLGCCQIQLGIEEEYHCSPGAR